MANMAFFQILIIFVGLLSIAGLVKANPVPLPTPDINGRTTSTSNFDSAFGAEATWYALPS